MASSTEAGVPARPALRVVGLAVSTVLFVLAVRAAPALPSLQLSPPTLARARSAVTPSDAGPPLDAVGRRVASLPAPRPPAPPPDPRTDEIIERLCEPAAAMLCAAEWRCCDERTPSCVDEIFAACTAVADEETSDRWNAGLEVSPEGLAATLSEIERATDACLGVDLEIARWYWFREAVELGEPCRHGGAACRGGICAFDGICRLRPGIGEAVLDGMCRAGLVARTDDRCGPPSRTGGPCSADEDCAEGLVCPDERCVPLGRDGARCELPEDCAVGLDCRRGRCRPRRACTLWGECGHGMECDVEAQRCVPRLCVDDAVLAVFGGAAGVPLADALRPASSGAFVFE